MEADLNFCLRPLGGCLRIATIITIFRVTFFLIISSYVFSKFSDQLLLPKKSDPNTSISDPQLRVYLLSLQSEKKCFDHLFLIHKSLALPSNRLARQNLRTERKKRSTDSIKCQDTGSTERLVHWYSQMDGGLFLQYRKMRSPLGHFRFYTSYRVLQRIE